MKSEFISTKAELVSVGTVKDTVGIFFIRLSDTYKNNMSLSATKTSRHATVKQYFAGLICPRQLHDLTRLVINYHLLES